MSFMFAEEAISCMDAIAMETVDIMRGDNTVKCGFNFIPLMDIVTMETVAMEIVDK